MSQHSCVCSFFGSFSDNCSWAERTLIVERRPQLDVPLRLPTAASYIREMDVPVLLPAFPPLFPPNVWPVLISVHRRARNWWRDDETMGPRCWWTQLDAWRWKKKWKKMKIQRQPRSAISSQHKAAFCRLGSQLRQVECGLIKGRRSGNFYPVAADKRVLFQRLTWFLWEKCENLDWQKEARCFFSPSPILWLFLVVGRLRPILDAGSKKTRHKTTPEDW